MVDVSAPAPRVPATTRSFRPAWLALGLALAVCYLAVVAIFADRKLLWTDELFTISIAQQPTLSRLFDALLHGPDVLPPLTHLATRVSISLLGPTHVAFRFPAAV